MISNKDFVRQSLELHLFFARAMKEHALFLQFSFTKRDQYLTQHTDIFRKEFETLLGEVITLSNGRISQEVIDSGEIITNYTLNAEIATAFYTGMQISTELTQAEIGLKSGDINIDDMELIEQVTFLNQRALHLTAALMKLKATILSNVLTCDMFTTNYPLMTEHIFHEAEDYFKAIQNLQNREALPLEKDVIEKEFFWNHIMAEHAKFIRGMLDPSEHDLFHTSHEFASIFEQLTENVSSAVNGDVPIERVSVASLTSLNAFQAFKAQGTEGILNCKVKSVINPLLADHVLREANHYQRLLQTFTKYML